jgi:hypothetical protein
MEEFKLCNCYLDHFYTHGKLGSPKKFPQYESKITVDLDENPSLPSELTYSSACLHPLHTLIYIQHPNKQLRVFISILYLFFRTCYSVDRKDAFIACPATTKFHPTPALVSRLSFRINDDRPRQHIKQTVILRAALTKCLARGRDHAPRPCYKKAADCAVRDVENISQRRSLLTEYHTVSRYKHTCNFIHDHNKSTALPAPIFMKITNDQMHYVENCCTEFHLNRSAHQDG